MKKTELLSMIVPELKALAEKMKIDVPGKAKKADIIKALLSASRTKKKAAVKKEAPKKEAVPKRTTAQAAARTGKPAQRKKAATAQKPAAPKGSPASKPLEPAAPAHEWKLPPSVEEPILAQERVSESKYYTGPALQTAAAHGELPQTYGQDRIVLLTRDPFVVHVYWEATPARLEREKAWFGWGSKLAVRIYDITGIQFNGRNAIGHFDQEVTERTGTWYFDLGRPSHSFCADVGLLSPEGRFLTLARSNYVTMPRDGVSDLVDDEWMLADEEFMKLYGYPEGFRSGVSSPRRGPQEWEMMRRRRLQEISSPGLFARERAKARRK